MPNVTKTKISDTIADGLLVVLPIVILLAGVVVWLTHIWHKYVHDQDGSPSVLVMEREDFVSRGRRFRRRSLGVFLVIALVLMFLGAILYASTTVVLRHKGDNRANTRMSPGDILKGLVDTLLE